MPTSLIAPVVGSIASAGASKLASSLFGGGDSSIDNYAAQAQGIVGKIKAPQINLSKLSKQYTTAINAVKGQMRETSASTPGMDIKIDKFGNVDLARSGEVQSILDSLRAAGDETYSGLTGLLDQVHPGFGAVTDARTRAIDEARQKTTGDLRDNLSRRRLAGSSFAADSMTRTEAEFANKMADARAQSFLEEMDATSKLLDQRFKVRQDVVTQELAQTNFETDIGAKLISQTRQEMAATRDLMGKIMLAKAEAVGGAMSQNAANKLTAQQQRLGLANLLIPQAAKTDEGVGATFGALLEPGISAIGKGTGDWLSQAFAAA